MALPTPMLSLLALATLLSVPAPGAAQQQTTNVTTGTSLQAAAGAAWPSPSGRFAFGFYATDGGLAVGVWLATTPNITVTWTANRNDTPSTGGALWLTYDGRLVWTGPADGHDRNLAVPPRPAATAAMRDDGSFMLYDANRTMVWSTFAAPPDRPIPYSRARTSSQARSSSPASGSPTEPRGGTASPTSSTTVTSSCTRSRRRTPQTPRTGPPARSRSASRSRCASTPPACSTSPATTATTPRT